LKTALIHALSNTPRITPMELAGRGGEGKRSGEADERAKERARFTSRVRGDPKIHSTLTRARAEVTPDIALNSDNDASSCRVLDSFRDVKSRAQHGCENIVGDEQTSADTGRFLFTSRLLVAQCIAPCYRILITDHCCMMYLQRGRGINLSDNP